MPRLAQVITAAMGPASAFVDITASVDLEAGITRNWGRSDPTSDTAPSTFTLTVDNPDGRYTPAGPDNVLPTVPATTLSASTAVGATSFTTPVTMPATSLVVIGTGALAEIVKTGTPTGAGPFTIPVLDAAGLKNAHSSGAAVAAMVSLAEGTQVCWALGTSLRLGKVQSIAPTFPGDDASWHSWRSSSTTNSATRPDAR
jgi:hypothetical protein